MRRIPNSGLAMGLGGVALVSSLTMGAALALPSSPVADALGLSHSLEARAEAMTRTADLTETQKAEVQRLTLASLRQSPAHATAWLRLAWIDSLGPQGLTDSGRSFLARSYAVAPYGPDDTPWRLKFAFDHWSRLDPDLRMQALAEYRLHARRHGRALAEMAPTVTDDAGRLAATMAAREARIAARRARATRA